MSPPRHQESEENEDCNEAWQESRLAKRPRCPGCCDDMQKELLEEMRKMLEKQSEILEMQKILQKQNEKIESLCRENQDLRENLSCLKADVSRLDGYLQQSPAPRMVSDQNCSIPLQLKFLNSCKNDKYSTRKIQADDETPLKVAICDHNNKIIAYEPFSSMRVQVVPIHSDFDKDQEGQWTEEYFRSKIVTGRPGKEQLLYGDLYIRLQDGVGYLNSAKFQDNSSFVASRMFKLGVMTADQRISQRIQEGITESFFVKDVRGYSIKKSLHPSPRDPVHKLSRIALNGDRHKLLEQRGIRTVGDFLCSYRKSPEDLRKVLGKISDQQWDMIINHALKCNPRPGISSGCIEERNISREHETYSRSNGSCYLQGSCSMQPSPAPQSLIEGIQTATEELVSGVGDEFLSVPSTDRIALEGDVQPHVTPSVNTDFEELPDDLLNTLFVIETELMREEDIQCKDGVTKDSGLTDSCSQFIGRCGRSSESEAASTSCVGVLPASDLGSRRHTGPSPSPARGADGRRSKRVSSPFGLQPRASMLTHRPAIFRRAEISAETEPDHGTVLGSQPNAQHADGQRPFVGMAATGSNPNGNRLHFHLPGEHTAECAGNGLMDASDFSL